MSRADITAPVLDIEPFGHITDISVDDECKTQMHKELLDAQREGRRPVMRISHKFELVGGDTPHWRLAIKWADKRVEE